MVSKKDVGQGFSAPVVAQGRLILFHRLGDKEVIEALDAATGKPVWKFDYATRYRDDFGFDEGPRAAPTIADGRVYTFGAEGTLHCLDFKTGKKIWSVDTHSKFQVRKGYFGAACSPLVDEGRVLMNIGGSPGAGIVAFDASHGRDALEGHRPGGQLLLPCDRGRPGRPACALLHPRRIRRRRSRHG